MQGSSTFYLAEGSSVSWNLPSIAGRPQLLKMISPFDRVCTVATCSDNRLLVVDGNAHSIWVVDGANGYRARRLAGSGARGCIDGDSDTARFSFPTGAAVDIVRGGFVVADSLNNQVRFVSASGNASVAGGKGRVSRCAENQGAPSIFNCPMGVASCADGSLVVADTQNHTIRLIAPDGAIRTIAGLSGESGHANGVGTSARFYSPEQVAIDTTGHALIGEGSGLLRIVNLKTLAVRTLTGPGVRSVLDIDENGEVDEHPLSLAIDLHGNVFVADSKEGTIRRISGTGLGPGHAVSWSYGRWNPTRQCMKSTPAFSRDAIMAVLFIWVREKLTRRRSGELPRLPLEIWIFVICLLPRYGIGAPCVDNCS